MYLPLCGGSGLHWFSSCRIFETSTSSTLADGKRISSVHHRLSLPLCMTGNLLCLLSCTSAVRALSQVLQFLHFSFPSSGPTCTVSGCSHGFSALWFTSWPVPDCLPCWRCSAFLGPVPRFFQDKCLGVQAYRRCCQS